MNIEDLPKVDSESSLNLANKATRTRHQQMIGKNSKGEIDLFRLQSRIRVVIIICICTLTLIACGTGEIQNFEGISILTEPRVNRIEVTIFLTDKHGVPLIWNQSILSPGVGVSTLSDADFTTKAKVYSMRNGEIHRKVYDGRLIDVRWAQEANSLDRLLKAQIPLRLIEEDPERDTYIGVVTVEIKTDRQGPFSDTDEEAIIYSR